VSQGFTTHPYITDSIIKNNKDEFNISDIRDLLLASTMRDKSKGCVRMFVSKQLNIMVKQGMLTTSGNNRNKLFRKTQLFEQFNTSENEELEHNKANTGCMTKPGSYVDQLNKTRSKLNAELAMLIAEMDEYRSIIAQFPQTKEKVSKLYEESTQHSATLTGQITAISKTIEVLQSEAV
jgi:septal ring factor EnvC (AmiA/AmiB activator)